MGRVPNYKARELVIAFKPFRGGNIFARKLRAGYCVYSYTESWPIYLSYRATWFGNLNSYSRTTARHARLLRPAGDIVWLPRALMQVFALYADQSNVYSDTSLQQFLNGAGLGAQPVGQPFSPAPEPVTTHMANTVVDWNAVRKRRVMPV